jgi:hypothetical protein
MRDLADIEAVFEVHPRLDVHRLRRGVREFSSVLEMPEIVATLDAIIKKHGKRRRLKK